MPEHDLPATIDQLLHLLWVRLRPVVHGYTHVTNKRPLEDAGDEFRHIIRFWELHRHRRDGVFDWSQKAVQEDVLENSKVRLYFLVIDVGRHIRIGFIWS